MDASVSTLTALAVFESTVEHGAVRSVHGYRVVGRKAELGWVRWEKWVERGFVLSPGGSREVGVSPDAPRILLADWRGRPAFREGQTVGEWRCIVSFDSVAAVAPTSPPPTMLCPVRNPQLKCLPNLYNDLEKVFQFQSMENLPQLIHSDTEEQQRSIHLGERKNLSNETDYTSESDSDSDEDPQSGTELLPPVRKYQRANKRHVASITLADIARCFDLPIREASKTLKIGVSILKKKCREYGIPRWPHRKIKSLDSLIYDLEGVLDEQTSDDEQQEKEKNALAIRALEKRKRMLEKEKEIIRQKPASDLMTETKLFREDVFKRRNRARRASD